MYVVKEKKTYPSIIWSRPTILVSIHMTIYMTCKWHHVNGSVFGLRKRREVRTFHALLTKFVVKPAVAPALFVAISILYMPA